MLGRPNSSFDNSLLEVSVLLDKPLIGLLLLIIRFLDFLDTVLQFLNLLDPFSSPLFLI